MTFFNSNFFVGLVTLAVGLIAIIVYLAQRFQAKKDAAEIILQEIRRGEEIITRYREHGNFQFTQKIIANNSWGKSIHFFARELKHDELDKISTLYSTGEFIDSIVTKIFEWKFNDASLEHYGQRPVRIMRLPIATPETSASNPSVPGSAEMTATQRTHSGSGIEIQMPPGPAFWDPLLQGIVLRYSPIYHCVICERLREISKRRWYRFIY